MSSIYYASDLGKLKNRKIFFDSNIILYIFWSTDQEWEKKYSSLFNQILQQNNEIFVDFLVISEIINRAVRIEYKKYLIENNLYSQDCNFKSYRKNKEGKEAFEDIYKIVENKILKYFKLTGKIYNKQEVNNFLCYDELDFVDKAIALLCKNNNFVLLTNDYDFHDSSIEILTLNKKLLKYA